MVPGSLVSDRGASTAVPSRVVYTTLVGRYERLNEVLIDRPADVRFVCLTDDPDLRSDTWEIEVIEPLLRRDPIRSQRLLKIVGHERLHEFDEWLYIDNCVRLRADPHAIFDAWLPGCDLAIPCNPVNDTVRCEFEMVRNLEYDSYERITEQLQHYEAAHPDVLSQRPYWAGFFARRPTEQVREAMRLWAAHVLRYSRRDQLSLNVALHESGLAVRRVQIDIWGSGFHEWPVHQERRTDVKLDRPHDHRADVIDLRTQLDAVRAELGAITSTRTWRARNRAVGLRQQAWDLARIGRNRIVG